MPGSPIHPHGIPTRHLRWIPSPRRCRQLSPNPASPKPLTDHVVPKPMVLSVMKVSRSSSRSSSPPCGRREAQAATGRAGDLRAAQWSLLATMPARGPAAHSTGLWLWVEDREGGALVLPLQLCVSPHFLPKAYGGFDASHHSHSHDRRLNN